VSDVLAAIRGEPRTRWERSKRDEPWQRFERSTGPGLSMGPGLSKERTEERLACLAASAGSLRRVLASIAARLLGTRAYERLCYARLVDYATERPGVSARQLQELARVHRVLEDLPLLERALVANALPWSKVRLVARVATVESVADWIARARQASCRRLEQEVRENGAAPAGKPEESVLRRRIALRCTPAVCEKWMVAREIAERVAGQRLRQDEVLELVAAEGFSELSIDPTLAGRPDDPPRGRWRDASAVRSEAAVAGERMRARALPEAVATLARGLEDVDAYELDRRLRRAVRLEQTLDAEMAPLLRAVRSAEYEWRHDHRPLAAYAPDDLGMSARKARALLRLERAGDVCPQLRAAYRGGQLSWVKAQCLIPLLLLPLEGDWRSAWVDWAARVTLRRLAADVERALLLRAGHHQAWQRCKFHPHRVQDPIPPGERQLCAPDVDLEATRQLAWRVPHDVALLFTSVLETARSRIRSERKGLATGGTDGEVFDALLDLALRAWTSRDPGARRADPVVERDGYHCAVPGCTSRRNLQDHHVRFRSAGGSDAASNRITLCAFHHQRCLHAGRLRITGRAPDRLVFELGCRPGRGPLARYASGDVLLPARPASGQAAARFDSRFWSASSNSTCTSRSEFSSRP